MVFIAGNMHAHTHTHTKKKVSSFSNYNMPTCGKMSLFLFFVLLERYKTEEIKRPIKVVGE